MKTNLELLQTPPYLRGRIPVHLSLFFLWIREPCPSTMIDMPSPSLSSAHVPCRVSVPTACVAASRSSFLGANWAFYSFAFTACLIAEPHPRPSPLPLQFPSLPWPSHPPSSFVSDFQPCLFFFSFPFLSFLILLPHCRCPFLFSPFQGYHVGTHATDFSFDRWPPSLLTFFYLFITFH